MHKPHLLNVSVVVEPTPDGSGNAMDGQYEVTCDSENLIITKKDTIINFYIVEPTPHNIIFTGLEMGEPSTQFSLPSVSQDGKMVMLSDLNTAPETNSILLDVSHKDASGKVKRFKFDPQVQNVPQD